MHVCALNEETYFSKETNDTVLFRAGKFKGVALIGGLYAYLSQKGIEQKVNLMKQR